MALALLDAKKINYWKVRIPNAGGYHEVVRRNGDFFERKKSIDIVRILIRMLDKVLTKMKD